MKNINISQMIAQIKIIWYNVRSNTNVSLYQREEIE